MTELLNKNRIAVISGLRTPFVKPGEIFSELSASDLGRIVSVELINRTEIDTAEIGSVMFGSVLPVQGTLNIAAEIALRAGLPPEAPAFSFSGSSAFLFRSFTDAASAIKTGDCDTVLCGGTDSVSEYMRSSAELIKNYRNTKSSPGSGETAYELPWLSGRASSGYLAEKLARKLGLGRQEQDEFSMRSRNLYKKAREEGMFDEEIIDVFVPPGFEDIISEDMPASVPLTPESAARLSTPYDEEYGTVTYASRAPLADGACAILMMSEGKAEMLGLRPLGFIKSYAHASPDSRKEPFMSMGYSACSALRKSGLALQDMDLIEWHESYSVQVLANMKAFKSGLIALKSTGGESCRGEVSLEKFNVSGGAIALGDALSASCGRQIITLLKRLGRRDGKYGLVSIGSAEGPGTSIVLERK